VGFIGKRVTIQRIPIKQIWLTDFGRLAENMNPAKAMIDVSF